ncbi:MAG: molybdenum cofactor guanylyltransferase [Chitinophagaceae bacterium]|nr:molybdenum cofactor guanylyltransferase [Chitinophagaceae bacterium]
MLGVILCGGKSSRMGTDKGLLQLDSKTWAKTAFDKMTALQVPVVLSVNDNQFNYYSSLFSPGQLIKDSGKLQVKGPLCGVLSVHLQYPSEDLMVLACDMPLLAPSMLGQLLNAHAHHAAQSFFFTNAGNPEPLCAIYTAPGLSHIISLLNANHLTRHSMKFVLEHLDTFSMPLKEDEKIYFRNFNAHAELNGL